MLATACAHQGFFFEPAVFTLATRADTCIVVASVTAPMFGLCEPRRVFGFVLSKDHMPVVEHSICGASGAEVQKGCRRPGQ